MRERNSFRRPPSPAQALVPETTYVPKQRPEHSFDHAAVEQEPEVSSLSKQTDRDPQPAWDSHVPGGVRRQLTSQGRRHQRQVPPQGGYQPVQGGRASPGQTRLAFTGSTTASNPDQDYVCWNCDKRGHFRYNCPAPKTLRCFVARIGASGPTSVPARETAAGLSFQEVT